MQAEALRYHIILGKQCKQYKAGSSLVGSSEDEED
jgi:hypothetical protein